MNTAQLRAFVAVVDEGSFSAAARALGVSQPAVTIQIRSLEEDLGVTLLDRHYRRLDLTEAGKGLITHARTVLAEMDRARDEIASLSGVISGSLLIASSTTPGDYLIPSLLGDFLAKYPNVDVSISIQDSEDVIRMVDEGTADVGVAGSRGSDRVDYMPFAEDELIVIAHPSHASGSTKKKLADVASEPWVMRKQGSGTQMMVEKALKAEGLKPAKLNVVVELGTGEAIVNAVEGGLGVAMVSRYVAARALTAGTLIEIPLTHKVERPFYVVTSQGTLTAAAAAFRDYLNRSPF